MRASLSEAEERAKQVGRMIKTAMPKGWGFVLVLASHGEGGDMTYLSSLGDRKQVAELLRELAVAIDLEQAKGGQG